MLVLHLMKPSPFSGSCIGGDCDIVVGNCCHNLPVLACAYNCSILTGALYPVVNSLNPAIVVLLFSAVVLVKKSLHNLGGE